MRAAILEDEALAAHRMVEAADLTPADREAISARAADLVRTVRAGGSASIMQGFLAEYGLSSREGVALMCLAEALLRVPDTETIDALIEDKIAASNWAAHLGQSSSPLVNASTWALLLTGKVLGEGEERPRRGAARRGQAARRAGHPRSGRPGDARARAPVRARARHGRSHGPRRRAGSAGLQLLLRHAGRSGPHRGGCAPLPPRLFQFHHCARRCRPGRQHPRAAGSLGQALGAASTLRVRPARAGDDRTRRADARAGIAREVGRHRPQRRCRGGGPPRPFARCHRGGARRPRIWQAGMASAWWCRPTASGPRT